MLEHQNRFSVILTLPSAEGTHIRTNIRTLTLMGGNLGKPHLDSIIICILSERSHSSINLLDF